MTSLPHTPGSALYAFATALLRPAVELHAHRTASDSPGRRLEWRQRRGLDLPAPASPAPRVWLHGASVGEAALTLTVAERLARHPELGPSLLSAQTAGGHQRLVEAGVESCFVPLDLRRYVERAFATLAPALLAPVETELWPTLLRTAARRGVPAVLLNARLSEKKMTRYLRWRSLYGPLVSSLARIGAQREEDAERFLELGAVPARVEVTGNVKFDVVPQPVDGAALRAELGIGADERVWVCGSTRPGEETTLIPIAARHRARLVLAPRHPERSREILAGLTGAGMKATRWSEREAGVEGTLVVDTLGVLTRLYAIADVAFVGGTLAPIGGHNVLEPAARGIPVLVGPSTFNVDEPLAELVAAGAARRCEDGEALEAALGRWLDDSRARSLAGAAAGEVVRRHGGATARSVEILLDVLRRQGAIGKLRG